MTNALNQTTQLAHYPCTGLLQSHKDQNDINAGRAGTTYAYDLLGRVIQKNLPDGGQVATAYNDLPPVSVTSTTKITSGLNLVSTVIQDGLGRVITTQLTSDPDGTTEVDTAYDALGRKSAVSNPYRPGNSEPTDGTTTYSYDPLDRISSVNEPDHSIVSTSYSGPCTTVTDEAGKSRMSCVDGLGRMTQVFEDSGSSPHFNYETDYAYDALDNLFSVNQKGNDPNSADWRTRTFTYDSLSRLLTASNPESSTISYAYDPIGNLSTKVAPAPNQTGSATVTTSYTYDALDRLTQKSYSDGATASAFFAYDGPNNGFGVQATNLVGRLDEEWIGTSCCGTTAEIFGYDPMGRTIMNEQYTVNMGYRPVDYTYNLAGDTTSASNGEGVTISYNYDAADRPTSLTSSLVDSQHPATLFTADPSVGYFPSSQLRKGTFGNGLVETNVYNNRLQPCLLDVVNSPGVTLQTCNDSTPGGNVLDFWMGYGTTNNNGNVLNWNATGAQSFVRTYSYDSLNRLSTMSDSASGQGCKGLQWTYDAWGNRTNQSVTSGSCNTFSAVALSNNRLAGYQYDAAGNMTNDGRHSYTYDAENRIISVDGGATTYLYDAEGLRAEKKSGGWTDYIHDVSGNHVTEIYATGWGPGYVYMGGKLIAQYANGTTYFVHSDHLGSTRLMTDLNRNVYDSMDYLPFGEQIAGDTGTSHKFTGKERDAESGLDMFGARYYGSSLGRFMTPDWAAKPTDVPYANFGNPQSLNLYSYVENNPTTLGDPDGHCCDWDDVSNFVGGALNAYASDNLGGAGRVNQTTASGQIGAAVGDAVATVQGAYEANAGAGLEGGGLLLDSTGAGALAGVPANVVGAGLMVHGATTAVIGGANLVKDANQTSSGSAVDKSTPENQERMSQGKAPLDKDGKPVELHHEGQTQNGPLKEMTQQEHRGGENFAKNHTNTGQQPSQINRSEAAKARRQHWKKQVKDQ